MSIRQEMIYNGMSDAIREFWSATPEHSDLIHLINKNVLKRLPDATPLEFQQGAIRSMLENREFGYYITSIALKFYDPGRPDESVRDILTRAAVGDCVEARTLAVWFGN